MPCPAHEGDALFRDALIWKLAEGLALPLARDADKANYARAQYDVAIRAAKTVAANEEQKDPNTGDAPWIAQSLMARNPWGHRRFSMTVLALGVLLALPAYHWRSRYLFADNRVPAGQRRHPHRLISQDRTTRYEQPGATDRSPPASSRRRCVRTPIWRSIKPG